MLTIFDCEKKTNKIGGIHHSVLFYKNAARNFVSSDSETDLGLLQHPRWRTL